MRAEVYNRTYLFEIT